MMQQFQQFRAVALRKESVDRNINDKDASKNKVVALRKESVDRNAGFAAAIGLLHLVALRKESVDRNYAQAQLVNGVQSRSPQGERG